MRFFSSARQLRHRAPGARRRRPGTADRSRSRRCRAARGRCALRTRPSAASRVPSPSTKRERAAKARRPPRLVGTPASAAQQLALLARVVAVRPPAQRAEQHAGRAVERVDLEAAVVGQRRQPRLRQRLARLLLGVAGERRRVLVDGERRAARPPSRAAPAWPRSRRPCARCRWRSDQPSSRAARPRAPVAARRRAARCRPSRDRPARRAACDRTCRARRCPAPRSACRRRSSRVHVDLGRRVLDVRQVEPHLAVDDADRDRRDLVQQRALRAAASSRPAAGTPAPAPRSRR